MSRILFITEFSKAMLLSGGFVAFGPMWLSAILKKDGHQCEISNTSYEEAEGVFESFKPDIVAFTAYTGGHVQRAELNKKLKQKYKFYSMLGGSHPTLVPEMIEEWEDIDALCIGEGFEAMPEFINKLEKGEDITKVPNWWVRVDNKIYKNSPRPLMKNLDSLPFPDRSLYNKYEFYMMARTATVSTSFGCPFECTYCYNSPLHDMRLDGDPMHRRRSVDIVIKEIKQLRKDYPKIEYLIFRDDIFNLNENWLKEFAEKYSLEIGLKFFCPVRPELVTETVADYLKKAGCYYVGAGVESGNDHLRNVVLKRPMTKEQIVDGLNRLRERNIRFTTYNLIGTPGETLETAMETWELNVKCRPTFADSCILTPYPKTEIYKYAVENGYLDPDVKYPLSFRQDSLLKLKDKKRLENFHQLFGISVRFPFLMPIVKILIRLPFNSFYTFIRKFWKGYCFRYMVYPYRVSLLQSARVVYSWMFVHKG